MEKVKKHKEISFCLSIYLFMCVVAFLHIPSMLTVINYAVEMCHYANDKDCSRSLVVAVRFVLLLVAILIPTSC